MYHGRLQISFYRHIKVFTQLHKTAYRIAVFISVDFMVAQRKNIFTQKRKKYRKENISNGIARHQAPRSLQHRIRFHEREITAFPLTYEVQDATQHLGTVKILYYMRGWKQCYIVFRLRKINKIQCAVREVKKKLLQFGEDEGILDRTICIHFC